MEERLFGKTGKYVTEIGLGTWQLGTGCVRSFTVSGKGRDVAFHLPADDIRDAVLLQLGEECGLSVSSLNRC